MDTNRFTFFQSYAEALEQIEDAEEFRACCIALWQYALTGEDCAASSVSRMFMTLVKPTIDKSKAIREGAKNGGSRTKGNSNANESPTQALRKPYASPSEAYSKPTASPSEQDIGVRSKDIGDRSKDIGVGEGDRGSGEEPEKRKRFTPPSVEEVAAYCREKGYTISPEHFIDFYQSVGWKVGNKSMKDWKAAVRTWQSRERQKPKNNSDELDDWMLNMINGGNTDGQTGDSENYFFDQGHVSAAF